MSGIAVVIVNYRTSELVGQALEALAGERAAQPGLRVVVVDGNSGDGSAERLMRLAGGAAYRDWVTLLPLGLNGGFGWANNQAIQRLLQSASPPDYIHLLNPDAIVEPGAVTALAKVLDAHPRCAAVGSLLLEPDGAPSGSAFAFPSIRTELLRGLPMGIVARLVGAPALAQIGGEAQEVDWATGASVMLRAEALREVGLFDTGFFLYFEETELMWRLGRAGWTIRTEPASRVRHIGGVATGVNGSQIRASRPPLPPYWYASRRRFLALTRGPGKTVAASAAYLLGHGLLVARRAIGSGRQHMLTEQDARRLVAHGLAPSRRDTTPAIARWNDPIDQPPAWMAATDDS